VNYSILITTTIIFAALPGHAVAGDKGPVLLPPDNSVTGINASEPIVIPSRKRRPAEMVATEPIPTTMAPEEMHELIRAMVLDIIPYKYNDTRKWNRTKEVVSGLNVRVDGFRVKTNRRRKMVNHGTWKRYTVELLNPKQEFDFKIDNIKTDSPGKVSFRASVVTPLRVTARLQEWSYGARLLSISTEAETRVQLQANCQVGFEMDGKTFPPDVIIKPGINAAYIRLIDFEVKRISHVKGSLAKEMGRTMQSLVERQIENKREQLAQKINQKIAKQQDRFRLSLSDLLSSKWGKVVNPEDERTDSSAPAADSPLEKPTADRNK
jgi:hypothetical protein